VGYAWSSWIVNNYCARLYYIPVIPPLWDTSHDEEFRRFENGEHGAIKAINWTIWSNDSVKPTYLRETAVDVHRAINFNWHKTALEYDPVDFIFLSTGSAVGARSLSIRGLNYTLRHEYMASSVLYYEHLLGSYLAENYKHVLDLITPHNRYDLHPCHRQFGTWWFGAGYKNFQNESILASGFYVRNRMLKF